MEDQATVEQQHAENPSRRMKYEIFTRISKRLADEGYEHVNDPKFSTELVAHLHRLPTRYALDVIITRVGNVLTHIQLLQQAEQPKQHIACHVRAINPWLHDNIEESTTSPLLCSPRMGQKKQTNSKNITSKELKCSCLESSPQTQSFKKMTLVDSTSKGTSPKNENKTNKENEGYLRYAWGVNTERVEYVLTHKKMLQGAISGNYPAFHVRSIHVPKASIENENVPFHPCTEVSPNEDESESPRRTRSRQSMHSAPSFGSSASFNALAFDAEKSDQESNCGDVSSPSRAHAPMHEVTFSTIDKPKLLSQLSALLVDVGLNIREAHVFSTVDGYSLDVFVVDGWHSEDTQDLQQALEDAVARFEKGLQILQPPTFGPAPLSSPWESDLRAPNLSPDDWEIDYNQLKCVQKVASGSFGDLYRGTYCGQDVAIKILKSERLSESLQREFAQEVLMMRKVRHKNAVQLIGTCTKLPHLCIVTEFMSGGSLYDYLHKRKGTLKLPMVLRVAIDISKGMDYLHQSNIIHRDLKSANILMDENEVVKVADFGVARFQAPNGVMTAETGTYRWMAPEVIEHKPYDRKADVFSFGIVLWELLTGKLPYDYLTPLQAAVSVVQKGLRPSIPKHAPPKLTELLERCWCANPAKRPEFSEITLTLQKMDRELEDDGDHDSKKTEKKTGGLFSTLKKSTGVH